MHGGSRTTSTTSTGPGPPGRLATPEGRTSPRTRLEATVARGGGAVVAEGVAGAGEAAQPLTER
eukprot:3659581-Lingulodinium_polyedra.AAC.1